MVFRSTVPLCSSSNCMYPISIRQMAICSKRLVQTSKNYRANSVTVLAQSISLLELICVASLSKISMNRLNRSAAPREERRYLQSLSSPSSAQKVKILDQGVLCTSDKGRAIASSRRKIRHLTSTGLWISKFRFRNFSVPMANNQNLHSFST